MSTDNSVIWLNEPGQNDADKIITTQENINGKKFTITNFAYGLLEPSLESQLRNAQTSGRKKKIKPRKNSVDSDSS